MNKLEAIDISHIRFTSMAQPSDEDIALWDSLSDEEKNTVYDREIEDAMASGLASHQTMSEIIAEANAELRNEV